MPRPADDPVRSTLNALAAGRGVGERLASEAVQRLMGGGATPIQAAAMLMGLRARGETADELAGVVRALRAVMHRVDLAAHPAAIDTCGTGGGAVSTFNISTAAAVVAVGAGAKVAKHGNRSFTSRCGSADVLEALGVPVVADGVQAAALVERVGMAFLFAPAFHPAMKYLAPVRKELGVTTIMNLAGPLANPAGVRRQVVGVADPDRAPVVAHALARLEPDHAVVVHGRAGMDEISPEGPTDVWEIRGSELEHWALDPARYGLDGSPLTALAGGDPPANADRMRRLLEIRTPTRSPGRRSCSTREPPSTSPAWPTRLRRGSNEPATRWTAAAPPRHWQG